PAGPGRLGPPAGGCPEKEVIHWIVAVWLRWRWRPRRGTRTLWCLMSSLHGNPAPPRPNVLGPGPQGPGPVFAPEAASRTRVSYSSTSFFVAKTRPLGGIRAKKAPRAR